MIRVLIADQVARIVGDLEKLAPYGDAVDVCGVAHQPSAVIEEAWLRQPDVLLLHETFAELPPADFAAHLGSVSPATRVLLMTAGDAPAVAGRLDAARSVSGSAPVRSSSKRSASRPGIIPPGGGRPMDSRCESGAGSAAARSAPGPARAGNVVVVVLRQGRDRDIDDRDQPRRDTCRGGRQAARR